MTPNHKTTLLEAARLALGWIDTGPQQQAAYKMGDQAYYSKLVSMLRAAIRLAEQEED